MVQANDPSSIPSSHQGENMSSPEQEDQTNATLVEKLKLLWSRALKVMFCVDSVLILCRLHLFKKIASYRIMMEAARSLHWPLSDFHLSLSSLVIMTQQTSSTNEKATCRREEPPSSTHLHSFWIAQNDVSPSWGTKKTDGRHYLRHFPYLRQFLS